MGYHKNVNTDERLTPAEWAKWVLLCDPYARDLPPGSPLTELKKRIETAINEAVLDERNAAKCPK